MCSFAQQMASESFHSPGVPDAQSLTLWDQSGCSAVVLRSQNWADFDFDDDREFLAGSDRSRALADSKLEHVQEDLAKKTSGMSTLSGSGSFEAASTAKSRAPEPLGDGACQWIPVAVVSPDGQMSPMALAGHPQIDGGMFGFQPACAWDGRKAGGKTSRRRYGLSDKRSWSDAYEGQQVFDTMAHSLLSWCIGNAYANFQAHSDTERLGETPCPASWGDPCETCKGKLQRLCACLASFDGSPESMSKLQRQSETLFNFRNSPMMPKVEQTGSALGTFDGDCRNCGKHGHKKSNCPEFDRVMKARRAATGKACPYCGSCPPPAESQA